MQSIVSWARRHQRAATAIALAFICVFGFTLRVWNLNWDEGTHQHPDERFWSIVTNGISAPSDPLEYLDSGSSPLNPYNIEGNNTFVYGTFPLFATKATAAFLHDGPPPAGAIVSTLDAVGIDLRDDNGRDRFDAGYNANLIGRLLSAVLDTGTIVVVFLLGSTLFDRRVGFVAALLQASTVLHIQYSHFHGGEIWVTFFTTVVVLGSVHLARRPEPRRALWVGVALGVALASKFTAAAAVLVPLVALALWLAPDVRVLVRDGVRRLRYGRVEPDGKSAETPGEGARRRAAGVLASAIWLGLAAFVTFRLLQPYAFDGIGLDQRFSDDIDYITGVNAGGNFPWVFQWIGVTPLIHPVTTAFWWGMGPALGLAAAIGIGLAVADVVRRRRFELLVPLSLIVMLLGLVSRQFNPLIRYMLPGYPVAIVLAGYAVVRLWDAGRRSQWPAALRRGVRIVPVALVAFTVLYALAFTNGVYGQEHPRVAASRWIDAEVPEGSVLSAQAWDDRLPLGLIDVDPARFQYVEVDPFFPDRGTKQIVDDGEVIGSITKTEHLISALDQADYVVEASNKLYGAIPRFPAKYPVTTAYYEALFDGRLGFVEVARFRNNPSLFGIEIDTSGAEETFTVYDHPTVTVWRKTDAYSSTLARSILNGDAAAVAVDLLPSEAATNASVLPPEAARVQQSGGTWTDVFDPDGITSHAPWLWWLLWLQVAALAAVPWVTWLFRRLPDQGYPLTKLLGLLAIAGPVWAIVAWDIAGFSAGLVWLWSALVVGGGAALGVWRRHELRDALRTNWQRWLGAEVLFLAVFVAVLALRAANPDLWHPWYGGEKPMEVAYLTAITKSSTLPAFDPWFGGGAMNYYYGGWFILAVPIRALRIVPEVAFNLGLPTYAAMSATVAYSTVANLVSLGRRSRSGPARPAAATRRSGPWTPVGFGVLGAALLLLAGNLDAVRIQVDNMWTDLRGGTAPAYDWWAPSRVNHGLFDITEFPYWSLLYGDLHPHVMGIGFLGLVVAVGLAYVVSARASDTRRSLALAVALGLGTGVVRMVHTWDLPAALALGGGMILLGQLLAPDRHLSTRLLAGRDSRPLLAVCGVVLLGAGVSGGVPPDLVGLVLAALGALLLVGMLAPSTWRPRMVRFVGHITAAGVVHAVVFWPYIRWNEVYDSGLIAAPVTTPFSGFAWHWSLFLIPIGSLVVLSAARRLRALPAGHDRLALLLTPMGLISMAIAVIAIGIAAVSGGAATVVCAAGVSAVAVLLLAELTRPADADVSLVVTLGLSGLALGIIGGVDVVTVVNDIERMNTVFKFWYAAWHLLAVASAVAVWRVTVELTDIVRAAAGDASASRRRRHVRQAWLLGISALLLVSLTYPVVATRPRLEQRFAQIGATLDGLAYLDERPTLAKEDGTIQLSDDLPLIDWLRQNVRGSPVIAEASGPLYDWTSRVSILTGLPTVIGWDHHQRQQKRGVSGLVDQRVADTVAFFATPDAEYARSYLRRYGVSYVIVGTMEHRVGNAEALAAFAELDFLTEVFRAGDTAVYQVNPDLLTPQPPKL